MRFLIVLHRWRKVDKPYVKGKWSAADVEQLKARSATTSARIISATRNLTHPL
jgi:hypothetical protein